jgi:hypothetical protein
VVEVSFSKGVTLAKNYHSDLPPTARAFRDRLQQMSEKAKSKRLKFAWKDWIGSPTAWLALLISGVTAYYNLFYRSDDIRVSISSPSLFYNPKTELIEVSIPSDVTVINAGNRTAALTRMQIFFAQPFEGQRPSCKGGAEIQFGAASHKPLIVKAAEITSLELDNPDAGKRRTISVSDENKKRPNGKFDVISCATFSIILPDGVEREITIPLAEYTVDSKARWGVGAPERRRDPDKPIVLLRR